MKSRRALSAIVATLLIILLTLIAVGIVWVVIRNVVQSGAEQVDISAKCSLVDVSVTDAACDAAGVCNVTYTREAGGEDVAGVFVILSNGQTSNQTQIAGNLAPGDTRTLTDFATGLTSPVPTTAEIAAYFVGESGSEQRCSTTGTFEI